MKKVNFTLNKSNDSLAGIYIHIPFCKQACHYCDFHFSTSMKLLEELVDCLKKEISIRQHYLLHHPVSTIYFGGGTPSLLSPIQVEDILVSISDNFKLSPKPEITMEANPDDLTSVEYLRDLQSLGVNRLSLGIQSFQQAVLKWMNRAHSVEQAYSSFELSRKAGFENINLDLIYGIPLPEYNLPFDLSEILKLNPAHISTYQLTIEPATVFGNRLKQGLLKEVTEDSAAESFQMVMDTLRSHGYHQYEISNFSQPGKESQHNIGYWNGQPYLGIGPGAHSFDGNIRQYNVSSNPGYVKAIQNGRLPCTIENLTPEQRVNELIMLGLRTSDGLNLQLKTNKLEWALEKKHQGYLQDLVSLGYATITKNRLILSDKGKLIADRIAEDLFIC